MKLTDLSNTTLGIYASEVVQRAYYDSVLMSLDTEVRDVLHRRLTEALIAVRDAKWWQRAWQEAFAGFWSQIVIAAFLRILSTVQEPILPDELDGCEINPTPRYFDSPGHAR